MKKGHSPRESSPNESHFSNHITIGFVSNANNPKITPHDFLWSKFCDYLSEADVRGAKDGTGFVLAQFSTMHRAKKNVVAVTALGFDVDGKDQAPLPPLIAHEELSRLGWAHVVYTTWSHSPESPRYRIILALDAPLPPDLLKGAQSWVMRQLPEAIAQAIDRACLGDYSRLYYAPATPPERASEYEFYAGGLAPLSTQMLTLAAKEMATRKAARGGVPRSGDKQHDLEMLREALFAIPNDDERGGDRSWWFNILCSVKEAGGEEAREIAREWSKQHSSYFANDDVNNRVDYDARFDKTWDSITVGKPDGAPADYVFAVAEQNGWLGRVLDDFAVVPPDEWPEPSPLTAKIDPEPYPLDALPRVIREAVVEVQGFTKAPWALIATSALSALSLAVQAHYDVSRAEKLTGPCGLFSLVIADSGERKSTVDGFFTSAIRDYEESQAEIAKPQWAEYRAAMEAWESAKAGIKDAIRAHAKAGKSTVENERQMHALETRKPIPPRVPRLIYSDVTPEALAYNLAKQWPSGGIVSAEAGSVLGSHGMGKDSVMRNLALLNQLWDGARFTIDRRTSESFTVWGARLTVGLQIQEATLRDFLDNRGALARGTGFLARFLVAWPESTQGFRPFTEAPPSWPALEAFNSRIAAILEPMPAMTEDGSLTPAMLELSPAAKTAWVAFHDAIEAGLASGGELYDVRDAAAKSADNAVRLAALLHIFLGGVGPVSHEAFVSASQIVAWHLHESRRFFGELALPAELADAARLDSWLLNYCKKLGVAEVSSREAQRLGPVRDKDRLARALQELADLDRTRVVREGKRKVIHVNPALLKGGL
jgi:hypothetical protein